MNIINSIDEYCKELNALLYELPQDQRENVINEIKDHLQSLKNDIKDETENAEKTAIKSFISPDKLANQILIQHKNNVKHGMNSDDFGYQAAISATVASFALFAVPLLGRELVGTLVVGILQLLLGSYFTFNYYKKRLNIARLKQAVPVRITMIFLLGVTLMLFAYNFCQEGTISYFSSIYLFLYLILWSIYMYLFYNFFEKGKRKLFQ